MTKKFLLRSDRPWLLAEAPRLPSSSAVLTVSVFDGDGNPVELALVKAWVWITRTGRWLKYEEEVTPTSGVVTITPSWQGFKQKVKAYDGTGVEEYESREEIFYIDANGVPTPDHITLVVGPPSQQPHDLTVKVIDRNESPVEGVKVRASGPLGYVKTKQTDELGQAYWDVPDDDMINGTYKAWGYKGDLQTEEFEFTVENHTERKVTPNMITLHLVYEREIPWWEALGKYVPWIVGAAVVLGAIYVLKPPAVVVIPPRK